MIDQKINNSSIGESDPTVSSLVIYSDTISLAFLLLSFLCSLFVLFNLYRRNKNSKLSLEVHRTDIPSKMGWMTYQNAVKSGQNVQQTYFVMTKREMFTRLTQFTITSMILSDLIFSVLYFVATLLRLIITVVPQDPISREKMELAILGVAEWAETFLVSSCIWSLLITLCIYLTISSIHSHYITSPVLETVSLNVKSGGTPIDDVQTNRSMRLYKIQFIGIGTGVPLLFGIMWTLTAVLFSTKKEYPEMEYLANVIPDFIKTIGYIVLEAFAMTIRVAVYRAIKKILSSAAVKNSASAIKKEQKLRSLVRQLTLYSLSFVLFGVWLIIYRTYFDVLYTIIVIKEGIQNFHLVDNLAGEILIAIHHILLPLRGTMNAIVYGILSKWFQMMFKNMCCRTTTEDGKQDLETTSLLT
jgi:hypothetical protein